MVRETNHSKLWMPVILGLGSLIYFTLTSEPDLSYGFIFSIFGLIGIAVIRWRYPLQLNLYIFQCVVFLLGSGFCLAWLQTHRQEPFYRLPTHAATMKGKIRRIEILSSGKTRVLVHRVHFLSYPESEQKEWHRYIQITLFHTDHSQINVGDWIEVKAMLKHPFPPVRMASYDLQFHDWFKNIGAYGYAIAPINVIRKSDKTSIQLIREKIAYRIRILLPGETGAIAQILLTGIDANLSQENRHVFAVAGLAHLLAIAGLHLGTVMLIVGGTVRWLLLRSEYIALHWPVKMIALSIGWIAGCIYLLLTGFHLPAIRSLIMASLIVFALSMDRRSLSMHNLMLAALMILIFSPSSIMNVSFQMSMAAVMAIIAGYGWGYDRFFKKSKNTRGLKKFFFYISEAAWISFLAGLAVCPIVMAHFHELNLYFILANLIAIPATMFLIMPTGLLSLVTIGTGIDYYFLHLMAYGINLVINTARIVNDFPYAVIWVKDMPGWGLTCYFIGLCIICLCVTRLKSTGILLITIGIISCLWGKNPDLVTSADGQMIAIRRTGFIWVICQHGCNKYTIEGWKRYLGVSKVRIQFSHNHDRNILCKDFYCKLLDEHVLIILKKPENFFSQAEICHAMRLEISLLWEQRLCPDISFVDKEKNWVYGSHSIWLNSNKIKNDLSLRGNRPWVMEPIQRGIPNLPEALSE